MLVIEQNANFCAELRKKFKNVPNVFILHGDAGRVEDYLKRYGIDHADYIVSGLPFASLPKAVAKDILNATRRAMGRSGSFITFQSVSYTHLDVYKRQGLSTLEFPVFITETGDFAFC